MKRTIVMFVISALVLATAFYISIYLWLFIMYFSGKTTLEAHSLIGAGIAGMAVVFVLCWLGVKLFWMKNA
ncbi:MAG: hypothetical protein H6P96_1053 [Candidatus Aminicenantes bacterium]|nr:hypothetical protein [Candidatus Aminicenantes bacterium]